jgi:nitrogen fixation/metabolism regulation signal transduction histidine kinase
MRNVPALASILLGLLATAAIPAAVIYADRSTRVELIWAGVAVPVAFVLGLTAILAARAGRRRARMTLLRRSGSATARLGRLLGVLGILLAGTGAIALAVYEILTYRGGT